MSDRALAAVFFVSLALVTAGVAVAPLFAIAFVAAIVSGGTLAARGFRRGGRLAWNVSVGAGTLALLLAISIWLYPFALIPGGVGLGLAVKLRRGGDPAWLPLVLSGTAVGLVVVITLLVVPGD